MKSRHAFSRRDLLFSMRLSELGKYGQDTAVLWHEAIARRKDNYVSSAFHKFIESLRDIKDLTI